ncbi:hypothetical protein CHGG_02112 [Chaetomium globosum CBS 148.51]|uniref:Uncharacterized protein n=1 Tax=Chaetomium globosum (strain ATCC 6205 / CBS 148.51 / DSM 1962 / NBRC 6347 / NRRL 1970) TaxID=306901 RepID=Q2HCE2_CHAGB|nr:uncharacterized protein CHGG_02112 [Chaetomium globosum CBS 148.51]EAQ93877.1 hypothetical protein CHGG_02112 [Chaetomium globosum CBS 148.51]
MVRLKYGIHTVFISAMIDWPFSRLTAELLSILRDRYPDGLTASIRQPQLIPIPASDSDAKVAYALPKNPSDLAQGWKSINARETDVLGKKGVADMSSVAFAFLGPDADEAQPEFVVEVPVLEEEASLRGDDDQED